MAERHALVIGISQYKYLNVLESVVRDVEAIASILKEHGKYKVERYPYKYIESEDRYEIKAKEVKREIVYKTIKNFLFQTAANSDALLYFSGHGLQFIDLEPDEPKGGLAVYDSNVNGQNILLFSDLNKLFARARKEAHLSSLVVILDCCHAGMIIENPISFENTISKEILQNDFVSFQKESAYALLAACRGHQKAYYQTGGKSVLTQTILEGLKPERANEKGVITFFDLAEFVKTQLVDQGQHSIDLTDNASGLEIVSYSSSVNQSCVDGQQKSDFLDSLVELNFTKEDGLFESFLEENSPVGAFLIGSQLGRRDGQRWLIERFRRKHNLSIDVMRYLLEINTSYCLDTLWDRFYSKFESTIENKPTAMVEEIYAHWSNQNTVILELIGVEKLKKEVIGQFLREIWVPLSKKAVQNPSQYPLLLFLVDTGFNSDFKPDMDCGFDYDNSHPEIPVKLSLGKIKEKTLIKWADTYETLLKQQLNKQTQSFDSFKQEVINLNQKNDICTEDILEHICCRCSVNWLSQY